MAVFRVERNKGYTVMSNHHLRNKELSLKAKGLLSQMLSLPEDWDYTLKGLCLLRMFLSFRLLSPTTEKKRFCQTYAKEKRCNLKKDYNAF